MGLKRRKDEKRKQHVTVKKLNMAQENHVEIRRRNNAMDRHNEILLFTNGPVGSESASFQE